MEEKAIDSESLSALIKHEYPIVCGTRTHVVKCGELDDNNRLVVVIPGNPGAVDFYEEFMAMIHQSSGWPVWGLSFAGQSTIPKDVHWTKPDPEVFGLEGQLQHKVDFISEQIPDNVQLVLIGHSIGAYVLLHVLEKIPSHRVLQGILLFPTLEKMASTKRGLKLAPVLKYFRWLLVFLCVFLWLLPVRWLTSLTKLCTEYRRNVVRKPLRQCTFRGISNIVHPYCVWNTLYLGHVQMQKIVELPEQEIRNHIDKLRFYYGGIDHWCAEDAYERMREMFPTHERIEKCDSFYRHAFTIDANEEMAEKVSGWLKEI